MRRGHGAKARAESAGAQAVSRPVSYVNMNGSRRA